MIDKAELLKHVESRRKIAQFWAWLFPKKWTNVVTELNSIKKLVVSLDREPTEPRYEITTNLFDEEEIYTNCTVQVLHNSITDEYSVGWWDNEKRGEEE